MVHCALMDIRGQQGNVALYVPPIYDIQIHALHHVYTILYSGTISEITPFQIGFCVMMTRMRQVISK